MYSLSLRSNFLNMNFKHRFNQLAKKYTSKEAFRNTRADYPAYIERQLLDYDKLNEARRNLDMHMFLG